MLAGLKDEVRHLIWLDTEPGAPPLGSGEWRTRQDRICSLNERIGLGEARLVRVAAGERRLAEAAADAAAVARHGVPGRLREALPAEVHDLLDLVEELRAEVTAHRHFLRTLGYTDAFRTVA